MIATRVVLAVAVLTTGLFTGLLVYIVGMFQAMLSALDGTRFTAVMGRFLPAARKNVLNYLFTITGLTAPVVTLVLLRTHLDSAMFWLTAAAVVVFLAGPILTSRFAAEPLYDVMLGWDADDPPPGWQAARDRYYRINAVRMSSSLIAFALLTAALAQPTP
jgi:uncharacterized membrane protein